MRLLLSMNPDDDNNDGGGCEDADEPFCSEGDERQRLPSGGREFIIMCGWHFMPKISTQLVRGLCICQCPFTFQIIVVQSTINSLLLLLQLLLLVQLCHSVQRGHSQGSVGWLRFFGLVAAETVHCIPASG